jgi:hypothetical protein
MKFWDYHDLHTSTLALLVYNSSSKHLRSSELCGLHIDGVYFAVGLQTEEESVQKIIIRMYFAQSSVKESQRPFASLKRGLEMGSKSLFSRDQILLYPRLFYSLYL